MYLLVERALGRGRRLWTDLLDVRGRPVRQSSSFFLEIPFRFDTAAADRGSPALRCAVVCHCHHAHLFPSVLSLADRLPAPTDVLLTTNTVAKADELSRVFARWTKGRVVVRQIPNVGRDLPSKLIAFRDELSDYDVALFLHTKSDAHKHSGEAWRHHLFHNLAGDEAIVRSVLSIFRECDDVGLVFPAHWTSVVPWIRWIGNYGAGRALAGRMGIRIGIRTPIDFPSGSMFWARPKALEPLLALRLTYEDLPREPVGSDGTVLHALERLFLYGCEAAGFGWLRIGDPTCLSGAGRPLVVPDRATLRRLAASQPRLLPTP